jgi:nucleoside-diphosphate-sugar epimerase
VNVFITGIGGFIGSELTKTLFERGHHVTGSVSGIERLPSAPHHVTNYVVIRMNEEFDPRVFRGVDMVVHCAHDLRKGRATANREGTQKLARAAMEEGAKWQIFLGSHSAHEEATSEYGQTKFELERFFGHLGQVVVKPGLVIGHGGLFLKLYGTLKNYPVVPLIDGGKGKLPVISIQDLTTSLVQLIEDPRPGSFRFSNARLVSLKELLDQIKQVAKLNTVLLPVPIQIIYPFLWLSDKLRLPLQVDIDNVRSFRANQSVSGSTDLEKFVSHPMDLTMMIEAALKKIPS